MTKFCQMPIVLMFVLNACNLINKQKLPTKLIKSENEIGIGLIHFNFTKSIALYKSVMDSIPYDTLKCIKVEAGNNMGKVNFTPKLPGTKLHPYTITNGDSDNDAYEHIRSGLIRFVPELIFKVIQKTNDGFIVMVNEETFETNFIKVEAKNDLNITNVVSDSFDPNFVDSKIPDWYYFENWEQALKRAWYISYNENELYDKPDGKKIKLRSQFNKIDSVNGVWARLSERYPLNKLHKINGWIKWRDINSLKINIILNGGYE